MIAALQKHRSLQGGLLILPAALFLLVFFLAPFFLVLGYSLAERVSYDGIVCNFTLESYQHAFDPLYFSTVLRSGWIAALSTLLRLVLGYPRAYFNATRGEK